MSAEVHSGPPLESPLQDDVSRQVDRIVGSEAFRSSEILRRFLEYLATRTVANTGSSIKAKEIAAAVFGRVSHFDPQNDSIVRVQAGRLRAKLAEYYVSEGSGDDLVITLPKGSYGLVAHHRTGVVTELESRRTLIPSRRVLWYVAGLLLAATAVWAAASLTRHVSARTHVTPGLATFWRSFLANEDRALIVYSNVKVRNVNSERTLLLPSNGEVLGVFQITKFFTSVQKSVYPKHGPMLAWDEAKDAGLIFIGGPLAETPLRIVPTFHDFAFRLDGTPDRVGMIENLRPKKGELAVYRGSPAPIQFDYALVALTRSFSPKHRVITLAGISGYGTQGAAEFVTREDRIQELLSRLSVKDGGDMPSFEMVLRFNVQGEIAIQPEIVAVHIVK